MKIRFISNIPAPYKIDFFNLLGKKIDVEVIFEAELAPKINQKWYSNNIARHFTMIFLKKGIIEEKKINFKIFKYINKSADLIVFTNYCYLTEMFSIILAKIKRLPYALEIDGGLIHFHESSLKKKIKSFMIKGASLYLSPSDEADKYLIYYGANKNNIRRYPFTSLRRSDINDETYNKQELKRKLSIKEKKIILSIGQYIERKGFDWLIEAYRDLDKNIGIYIIGGKPTQEYINLKKKYSMDNLYFIDFLDKKEIMQWYQAADLFVLPTREDIWGLVINEALSFGLPTITTNKCVAGLELIKNDYNGFIVEVENNKDLLEKTQLFFSYEINKQIEMRKNCKCVMKNYTIESMVNAHLKILSDFLEEEI